MTAKKKQVYGIVLNDNKSRKDVLNIEDENVATLQETDLLKKLKKVYKNRKGKNISPQLFKECVKVASSAEIEEIEYTLFVLLFNKKVVDTGIPPINTFLRSLKNFYYSLSRDLLRIDFMIAVLECARKKGKKE